MAADLNALAARLRLLSGYIVFSADAATLREAADALAAAARDLERARTYTGLEGWACPLCTYEAGKFIALCGPHRQLAEAEAERDALILTYGNVPHADTDRLDKAEALLAAGGDITGCLNGTYIATFVHGGLLSQGKLHPTLRAALDAYKEAL